MKLRIAVYLQIVNTTNTCISHNGRTATGFHIAIFVTIARAVSCIGIKCMGCTKLVTHSSDASARLWEVPSGQSLGPPLQHGADVPREGVGVGDARGEVLSDGPAHG